MKVTVLLSLVVLCLVTACRTEPRTVNTPPTTTVQSSASDTSYQTTVTNTNQNTDSLVIDNTTNRTTTTARSADKPFMKANGSEPGWYLELYTDRLFWVTNYGEDTIRAAIEGSPSTSTYTMPIKHKKVTQSLTINVKKEQCGDDAGRFHPHSVTIKWGTSEFRGCGDML